MTQKQRIMRHLNDYGSITPGEAYTQYGIYRLSAVIFELRKKERITTTMVRTKNRYGEDVKYAKYILKI